jgi:diadenylate cyclase
MLLDVLFPFKWHDLLDILVISFILHRLFLLFHGTTALQIILGLLFLWVIQGIAEAGGLVLTSWFFQGIGAVAVLVIVVVFRNEIREVLFQTNPVRLFFGSTQETRRISVESIVQAVFQLAKTKTGALMVLQNRDRVEPHLREGFALDARFNPLIIESIFAKQSPIHDGAIIIRGNRISKVGTFLPLTQKEGLSHHFGSRHRAAIGLSEVSDAIILVVSEERGEVSLVSRGKVRFYNQPQELRDALVRLLVGVFPKKQPKRSRRRIWFAQAGGLLLTFLMVSLVWGIYSGRQFSLITTTTSIDFRNIPDNLELMKTSAEKVEIQISGKRRLVSALEPEQVGAFIDLQGKTDGAYLAVLNQNSIELPLGLEVVRVTPAKIKVELEQRAEKKLAVKPQFIGASPSGYEIKKIRVQPNSVKVSGAVSVLHKTNNLSTEPIDFGRIEPKDEKHIVEVPLALPSSSLRLIPGESKKVRVSFELQARRGLWDNMEGSKKRYHTVRSGETLWGISRRYGLTVEELRSLNNFSPGGTIYPDQRLFVGAANGK